MGHLIHQSYTSKRTQRYEQMYGWRPLKFRIEAFVNGFIDLVRFLFWFFHFSLTALSPSWRSLSLSLGTFCIHVPYLSPFFFPRRPFQIPASSPSLVHPIAHPIELGGWMDVTAFDSLPKLCTVNRRRGYSHPFNSHLPTPVLHLSPPHLPTNTPIYGHAISLPTHPPARPRTDARLHPLLLRHPPLTQPTHQPIKP